MNAVSAAPPPVFRGWRPRTMICPSAACGPRRPVNPRPGPGPKGSSVQRYTPTQATRVNRSDTNGRSNRANLAGLTLLCPFLCVVASVTLHQCEPLVRTVEQSSCQSARPPQPRQPNPDYLSQLYHAFSRPPRKTTANSPVIHENLHPPVAFSHNAGPLLFHAAHIHWACSDVVMRHPQWRHSLRRRRAPHHAWRNESATVAWSLDFRQRLTGVALIT